MGAVVEVCVSCRRCWEHCTTHSGIITIRRRRRRSRRIRRIKCKIKIIYKIKTAILKITVFRREMYDVL
jgi:Fe-S-cluster-containing hydrogenase component 2